MSFANNITNTVGTLGVSRGGTNLTATPTNGQLPIGNGTGYALATLTAGSGVTVTNGSGTITIAATGGGGGFTSVVMQTFTSSGTYTPTSGMSRCIVEVVGGGGGGGGAANTSSSTVNGGGGGGGGGFAMSILTAAQIGVSQTVTIGAGGTAGAAGNNAGGSGGNTSLGALVEANGGSGGNGAASNSSGLAGSGGTGATGTLLLTGGIGLSGTRNSNSPVVHIRSGGSSPRGYGIGGRSDPGDAGSLGINYGAGGGGGSSFNNNGTKAGAAGTAGIVIVTEFIT